LAVVFAVAIVAAMPVSNQLLARFDNAKGDTNKRLRIWQETMPIVRDFPLTGVGLGAYRMAMIVYQRSDRAFFFNDAHNEYLQFAAEGGLLVGAPLALAAMMAIGAIARGMREDQSTGFSIRAGAVASLTGVVVQSIWETGLEIPANAALFAVICAIAIHRPHVSSETHERRSVPAQASRHPARNAPGVRG
jgi:O-antigen ligase